MPANTLAPNQVVLEYYFQNRGWGGVLVNALTTLLLLGMQAIHPSTHMVTLSSITSGQIVVDTVGASTCQIPRVSISCSDTGDSM